MKEDGGLHGRIDVGMCTMLFSLPQLDKAQRNAEYSPEACSVLPGSMQCTPWKHAPTPTLPVDRSCCCLLLPYLKDLRLVFIGVLQLDEGFRHKDHDEVGADEEEEQRCQQHQDGNHGVFVPGAEEQRLQQAPGSSTACTTKLDSRRCAKARCSYHVREVPGTDWEGLGFKV
jgi:hypothetical protein